MTTGNWLTLFSILVAASVAIGIYISKSRKDADQRSKEEAKREVYDHFRELINQSIQYGRLLHTTKLPDREKAENLAGITARSEGWPSGGGWDQCGCYRITFKRWKRVEIPPGGVVTYNWSTSCKGARVYNLTQLRLANTIRNRYDWLDQRAFRVGGIACVAGAIPHMLQVNNYKRV
jgi:hypothetical protein